MGMEIMEIFGIPPSSTYIWIIYKYIFLAKSFCFGILRSRQHVVQSMATNMATWFFSKMDQPLFTGQQNDVEQSVKHGICTKIWFSCRRPVLFAPKSGATRTTFESEDGGGKVKCQTSFDMLSQNRWRRCITVTWVVICQGCSYFNATSIYNSRPPDT